MNGCGRDVVCDCGEFILIILRIMNQETQIFSLCSTEYVCVYYISKLSMITRSIFVICSLFITAFIFMDIYYIHTYCIHHHILMYIQKKHALSIYIYVYLKIDMYNVHEYLYVFDSNPPQTSIAGMRLRFI